MQCTARAGCCASPHPPQAAATRPPQPRALCRRRRHHQPASRRHRLTTRTLYLLYLPTCKGLSSIYTFVFAISVSGSRLELHDLTRICQTALSCAEPPVYRTARVESADTDKIQREPSENTLSNLTTDVFFDKDVCLVLLPILRFRLPFGARCALVR